MLIKTGLAAVFALAMTLPAMAADCTAPTPPDLSNLNGSTASEAQMKTAIGAFRDYQGEADAYETCIHNAIDAAQKTAKAEKKPADPAMIEGLESRSDAVQAQKEKVGGQLNMQIVAYKSAHPAPASPKK